MARLFIPSEDIDRIKNLTELSDKFLTKLIEALKDAPPGIWGDKLGTYIEKNTGIEQSSAQEVSRLLYTLYLNKRLMHRKVDEFVDELVISIKDNGKDQLELSEHQINIFRQLLSIKSIDFTTKAIELELEREKSITDTRIITDLRPIFDDDNPDIINSFLIVHNLKIKYNDYSDKYECYFSLDEDDLQNLKDQVVRALNKSKRIRKGIGDINILKLESE